MPRTAFVNTQGERSREVMRLCYPSLGVGGAAGVLLETKLEGWPGMPGRQLNIPYTLLLIFLAF